MAESLEKMLNENRSMFTKQHLVPCMAHVLNLVIQGGLKELGNPSLTSECLKCEDDEGLEEVFSKKAFGDILRLL